MMWVASPDNIFFFFFLWCFNSFEKKKEKRGKEKTTGSL